jgi:prepilin signal peptidase PulO-like enzyme (type II secretory pathway)
MAIFRLAVEYKLKKIKLVKKNQNRSYCDFCGRQLSWYENVPFVSWISQLGKTRCCGKKLPIQYPLLELSMGIIFLLIGNNYIYLFIASLLMFSLVFDLRYMILPDRTNLGLVFLSVLLLVMGDHNGAPLQFLLAGSGSLLFFFLLNRIKIRGSEAMGMGDVKYALFMGLFLGWPNVIVAIYFAFVSGAMVSIFLLLLKIVKKQNPIPFGPFLIIGTVVTKIWGEELLNRFLSVLL